MGPPTAPASAPPGWPSTLKNQIRLEHYYLPGQLEARLAEFVTYYNNRRYHERLNKLTRPISASAARKLFSQGGKSSSSTPSSYGGGCITSGRLNLNPIGSTLSNSHPPLVQHVFTTYSGPYCTIEVQIYKFEKLYGQSLAHRDSFLQ